LDAVTVDGSGTTGGDAVGIGRTDCDGATDGGGADHKKGGEPGH